MMNKETKRSKGWNLGMKFLLAVGTVIGLSMGAIFYWTSHKQEEYILQQVEKQSRILFQQILLTRQWVAKHGGVFVEKIPGVKTNPYLLDPEIRDERGKIYTKRNPALVTRELSEFAEEGGLYKFRVTGLRPLDPKNSPDDFERWALQAFDRKEMEEAWRIETDSRGRLYRYMAPLRVNESCLSCHGIQGYQAGEIKGGISILIPLGEADRAIRSNNWTLFFSGLGIMAAVIFTLYLLMDRLVIRPVRQLEEAAVRIGGGSSSESPGRQAGDEIGSLRAAFQEMDLRLKESRDHLEEKVRAATKDLEEANLKLKELDRIKSDFLSNASHELRTPLTAIRGAVDFLLRQRDGDGAAFLEIIKKNSERLIRLVTDLLDFSRIEAGKMEMQFSLADLSFLTEEVVSFVQNMADGKNVRISRRVPEGLMMMADEDRIKQVLINLLSNAIKFSFPGGRVDLGAVKNRDEVLVCVQDQGRGIAPEDREKIFTKFNQVGKHPPSREGGVGLGLAISKGIVEAHGGRIWVESRQGRGSTFFFSIPPREEDHEPEEDPGRR
jgi:signal transduction histidine kinase